MTEENSLLAPAEDPLLGTLIEGKYRVDKKIGEGGMGAVYLAEHTLIHRPVAIKCLHGQFARHPEVVARFQREAMAANAIRHQNIVEVTDLGRLADGAIFMVLEFLEGQEFTDLLEAEGALRLGRVVHIMTQVCAGLSVAHEKGIVHRDLKPENIYLIQRGGDPDFVKVLDFGIAKFRESLGEAITQTGTAMGTPYYMAPEQVKGAKDIDHRADIYSLGVILFHALTGQFPFFEDSFPMLVMKICTAEAPRIRSLRTDLPVALEELIARMLAKDPSDRPGSCVEVSTALAAWKDVDDAPIAVSQSMALDQTAYPTSDVDSMPATVPAGGVGPEATAAPVPVASAGSAGPAPATVPGGGIGPDAAPVQDASPAAAPHTTPFATSTVAERRQSPFVGVGLVVALVGLGGLGAFALFGTGGGGAEGGPSSGAMVSDPVEDPPQPADPGSAPASPALSPTAGSEPGEAPMIPLLITAVPTDALLFLDGEPIANPYSGELPRSDAERTIDARAPGYVSERRVVIVSSPQALTIELERDRLRPAGRTGGMRATTPEPVVAPPEMATAAMDAPPTTDEATPTMAGSGEEEGGQFLLQPGLRMFRVEMTN